MDPRQLSTVLDAAIAPYRLLGHHFYQRWSQGTVGADELRDYADQYRFFEARVPLWLQRIATQLPEGSSARAEVDRMQADETGGPLSHLELFDAFRTALGAPGAGQPSAAMTQLLATYDALVDANPAAGLAALRAYEAQSPTVSASKAEGLRDHYGMVDGVQFWDVHATLDTEHDRWAVAAMADLVDDADVVAGHSGAAASAWWAFLDEREALGTIAP